MKHSPLVSVIMPAFNEEQYIEMAIQSILSQTYSHFELIIVDDVSLDNTPFVIQKYARKFPHLIKAIFLKKHIGPNEARNSGFRAARGSFIAVMDADDISHPERLEKELAFLLSHPGVIVVGSQGQVIDKDGFVIGKKLFPLTHNDIYKKFGVYNPMLHPSCMIRRSLLPYLTKIYENVAGTHDDYYTFFSLLQFGAFANLPDTLHYYRVHGKNISLQNPRQRFYAIQKIRKNAVEDLSYIMSAQGYLLNLFQQILVAFLPDSFILPLYLYYRGMYSPSQLLSYMKLPQLTISFSPKV